MNEKKLLFVCLIFLISSTGFFAETKSEDSKNNEFRFGMGLAINAGVFRMHDWDDDIDDFRGSAESVLLDFYYPCTFYFPIITKNMKIDPEFLLLGILDVDEYETMFKIGTGIYKKYSSDKMNFYFGGRIGGFVAIFSYESYPAIYFGPAAGAEYFFHSSFGFGTDFTFLDFYMLDEEIHLFSTSIALRLNWYY
jgi:hypothetical protein